MIITMIKMIVIKIVEIEHPDEDTRVSVVIE